jgi:hypothetical protein
LAPPVDPDPAAAVGAVVHGAVTAPALEARMRSTSVFTGASPF